MVDRWNNGQNVPKFNGAAQGGVDSEPSTPKLALDLTIGGTVEQQVHDQIDATNRAKKDRSHGVALNPMTAEAFAKMIDNGRDRGQEIDGMGE